MPAVQRAEFYQKIHNAFQVTPIVAILGPRQCGKTTEARAFAAEQDQVHFFDLEDPRDLNRLTDPILVLENLQGIIIIDEIQRLPELFRILRVLIDKPGCKQRYLILGSASRELIRQSSESLAGRLTYLELTPFTLAEVHDEFRLQLRGGFPRSYLSETDSSSTSWRQAYITTFLEMDIPNLGIQVAAHSLRRFWSMLAHYHANIFNSAELGRSLEISHTAIRHYLDILTGTFMLRQLQPWFENSKKRQVKSPKIYFRDTGILQSLLGISSETELRNNPKIGAVWEGFALEQIIVTQEINPNDCYFWATHAGAELDLLIMQQGKRIGFEFKYSSTPTLTKSMKIASEDLQLDQLYVIYPGQHEFPLAKNNIHAIGLKQFISQSNEPASK